jgi:hypothetical protein
MMARPFIAAVLLVVAVTASDRLAACGDKYLNLGLGTRFERSPAERRAAAVLVYAIPGSDLSRTFGAQSVEEGMKKVGYQPTQVGTATEFDAALRARSWDVIVLDGRDSASVSQRLPKAGGPHLVPVLTRPTKDELKQARKMYETVLEMPSKSRVFVETLDEALDLHEIAAAAAAKRATKH